MWDASFIWCPWGSWGWKEKLLIVLMPLFIAVSRSLDHFFLHDFASLRFIQKSPKKVTGSNEGKKGTKWSEADGWRHPYAHVNLVFFLDGLGYPPSAVRTGTWMITCNRARTVVRVHWCVSQYQELTYRLLNARTVCRTQKIVCAVDYGSTSIWASRPSIQTCSSYIGMGFV